MTISSLAVRTEFTGDGVSTSFPIAWPFFNSSEVAAYTVTGTPAAAATELLLNSNYTISGGQDNSGTLVLAAPLAIGQSLLILRQTSRTQLTNLLANDNLPAATLEVALDRLAALEQEDRDLLSFAIRAQSWEQPLNPLVPAAARANSLLGFDANGQPMASVVTDLLASTALAPFLQSPTLQAAASLIAGLLPPTGVPTVQQFGAVAFPSSLIVVGNVIQTGENIVAQRVTDCTAAFQAAINSGEFSIPAGNYYVSSPLTISNSVSIHGAGSRAACLWSGDIANPIIIVNASNGGNLALQGFSLYRLNKAASMGVAAHGIQMFTTNTNTMTGYFLDIEVKHSFHGFCLGDANFFTVERCVSDSNQGSGFFIQNNETATCQYAFTGNTAQKNCGNGYSVAACTKPGIQYTIIGGPWIGNYTFANDGSGMAFAGNSTCFVADLNIQGSLLSNDGLGGISIIWGLTIQLLDNYIEDVGVYATGEGLDGTPDAPPSVPPSNTANGIAIDANSYAVQIVGNTLDLIAANGIAVGGDHNLITGNNVKRFGFATPTTGVRSAGVACTNSASSYVITGNTINAGPAVGITGAYGITTAAPHNTVIAGNDLSQNLVEGVPAPVGNGVAGVIMAANLGALTTTSGQASIAAGATQVFVTHYLCAVPGVVTVSQTTPLAAGTQLYANTFNAATFAIELSQAQSGSVSISWIANCETAS